jgi:signal transduction histidine kinase
MRARRGVVDGRLVLLTGVSALLGLLSATGVACVIGRRRTQRLMDAISSDLTKINQGERATLLAEPPFPDEVAKLVPTLNTTVEMCHRLRGFASEVSHELRNPLTGLRAELEDAEMHPDTTDVPELVARTLPSLDRTEAIVVDMLMLARVQTSREEDRDRFDLGQLIAEEVEARQDEVPIHIQPADEAPVSAVREQIRQVVTNLLDNAQRHATGRVAVEVGRRHDTVQLIVDDDGGGVAEADRQRIFERFTRLDAGGRRGDKSGAGLGLAIARDIALAHAGSIHVEDSPSGGARFVFRLPLASD